MKVDRLFQIDHDIHVIERLWGKITVFCEIETDIGRQMSLKRLKKLRDDISEVIDELEQEQEMEEWLS